VAGSNIDGREGGREGAGGVEKRAEGRKIKEEESE